MGFPCLCADPGGIYLKRVGILYRRVSQAKSLRVHLAVDCKLPTAFLVIRGVSPLPRATALDVFGAGLAIACFLNSSCKKNKTYQELMLACQRYLGCLLQVGRELPSI